MSDNMGNGPQSPWVCGGCGTGHQTAAGASACCGVPNSVAALPAGDDTVYLGVVLEPDGSMSTHTYRPKNMSDDHPAHRVIVTLVRLMQEAATQVGAWHTVGEDDAES